MRKASFYLFKKIESGLFSLALFALLIAPSTLNFVIKNRIHNWMRLFEQKWWVDERT